MSSRRSARVILSLLLGAVWAAPALRAQDEPEEPADLITAAANGDLQRVRVLLDAGADPDTADTGGATPLMAASLRGQEAVVRFLLDRGADPARRDTDGDDALTYAVLGSATDVAGLLLERGADPNRVGKTEWTPLHRAAALGDTSMVQLLLAHGGDLTVTGEHGSTVLHQAVGSGALPMVRLLLDRGAELDALNGDGWTPWMAAVVRFDSVMADTLVGRGARHDESRRHGIETLVEGIAWARGLRLDPALDNYRRAAAIDPELPITADAWNVLCWNGTLTGAAEGVTDACERAVRTRAEGAMRDSRGVNRAVRGDLAGALSDFKAFVEEADTGEVRAMREAWVAALERGENPMTPEVLEALRYPWLKGSAIRMARGLGYDLIAMVPRVDEMPDSALLQREGPGGTDTFVRSFAPVYETFPFAGGRVRGVVFTAVLAGSPETAEQTVQQLAGLEASAFGPAFASLVAPDGQRDPETLHSAHVTLTNVAEPVTAWRIQMDADTVAADSSDAAGPPQTLDPVDMRLAFLARGRVLGMAMVLAGPDELSDGSLPAAIALLAGKMAAAKPGERERK